VGWELGMHVRTIMGKWEEIF